MWTAAAAALCGDAVERVIVNTAGYRFAEINDFRDASFVPGIVKYGDVPALLALGAPHKLRLTGEKQKLPLVEAAYTAAGAKDAFTQSPGPDDSKSVLGFLLGK